jgi:hypothetical protein
MSSNRVDLRRGRGALQPNSGASSQKSFAKLCALYGGALVAGAGLIGGGWEGIEALRTHTWERDLTQAQRVYAGAKSVQAREIGVLAVRDQTAEGVLRELGARKEAMAVLLGVQFADTLGQIEASSSADRQAIDRAAALDVGSANLLAQRRAGLGMSEFIAQARALAGKDMAVDEKTPLFVGPLGFASENVAGETRHAQQMVDQIDSRLAQLKDQLARSAQDFTDEKADAVRSQLVSQTDAQIAQLAKDQASQQIEGYRDQVKQAASAAFENNGESMGDSDWDDINGDLENDPDWQSAKKGLTDAAMGSAQSASGMANDAIGDERAQALELAREIREDRSREDGMSVWEMALLMRWLNPQWSNTYVAWSPYSMASDGYSLTGRPTSTWSARGAWGQSQGQPDNARWRYPSGAQNRAQQQQRQAQNAAAQQASRQAGARASSSMATQMAAAGYAGAMAAQRGVPAAASAPSAVGSPTRSAISAGLPAAPSAAYAAQAARSMPAATVGQAKAAGSVDYAALNKMAGLSSLMANSQAQAQTKAAQAATQAATQAAGAKAAGKAATEAAEEASEHAAQKAAQSAAQTAAAKAADNAAQKAAQSAAVKAADTAAQRAAQSAAQRAAQTAAQNAASRAAQAAASRAAQAAASRAAEAAAQRAAQSASQKAAQSASAKASARSSSSSSSRSGGRR